MPNDTRLHKEGGSNLLAAAEELGVARYIMQSRGFYLDAPSGQLADETATLRYDAPGPIGESTRVMGAYEDRLLGSRSEGSRVGKGGVRTCEIRWAPYH